MRRSSLPFAATLLLVALNAYGHHSLASSYDSSRQLTLEGVVAEFHFVHPHPYLVIGVQGEGGTREAWRAEMDNRFELSDIGVTAETFKPGDRVTFSGSAGRTPLTIYVWRLDRPSDGLRYEQIGSTPHIKLPG